MSLFFAICDDFPDDRELLASLTRQWAAQTNTVVKLSEFTNAENYRSARRRKNLQTFFTARGRYHHRFGGFTPCQKHTATL